MNLLASSVRKSGAVAFAAMHAVTLVACASVGASETAAVLVTPTATARAELKQVVSEALGSQVTLAEDALTHDSQLLIEPTPARDSSGQRLSGRDFGRAEKFQLLTNGKQCVLVHERTGQRYGLSEVRCVATNAK
jgi:hypothetical protein